MRGRTIIGIANKRMRPIAYPAEPCCAVFFLLVWRIKPSLVILVGMSDYSPMAEQRLGDDIHSDNCGMESLLETLRTYDAIRDQDESGDSILTRTLSYIRPDFALDSAIHKLPPFLRSRLKAIGITRLYAHQAQAIRKALDGHDLVLESPTASGKTLCFSIPLILKLTAQPLAHALMLHPMKALSNDQRRQLEELTGGAPSNTRGIESWLYDGDTNQEHRKAIRDNPPAVLLTNPAMLHLSFLGYAEKWDHFLRNLQLIILDEMHEYRGFFGTNFSLLMRRFLNKLSSLGNSPQIILATATCANPVEHAQRLTGRDAFKLVQATNRMRPTRHFAFINPQISDYHFIKIYRLRIARAALACLSRDLTTIVFCQSRTFAESVCKESQRDADKFGLDPDSIVPYRSGYSASERREIEEGLRNGKYRVVFTTNALEIGIDIGRLDCCILAGFPDNVMSAWQRIGRTGRGWDKTAFVLFFAMNNAMDQFFVSNIDAFLDKPLDEILIAVDNEELIKRHVPFLLHECGGDLDESHRASLGDQFWEHACEQARTTKPVAGQKPPYRRLDIRGASGAINQLIRKSTKEEIGTISDMHLFREAFVGAIYNHRGETFRVTAHGAGEVYLESAEPHLRTEARFFTNVQSSEMLRGYRFREVVSVCYGKVTIYDNFTGYRLIDERSDDVLDDVTTAHAIRRFVRGFWLVLEAPEPFGERIDPAALSVLEQFIRIGSPFIIPCDRHDIATLATTNPLPSIYLYETLPGGIGIAEKMLEVWQEVMSRGAEIARECACRDGCARCIHPPRHRIADTGTLKKSIGFELMDRLFNITSQSPEERFDPDTYRWRSGASEQPPPSPMIC